MRKTHYPISTVLERYGEITEVDWFSSDDLPETEIMPADLLAIRHALSASTTLLVD